MGLVRLGQCLDGLGWYCEGLFSFGAVLIYCRLDNVRFLKGCAWLGWGEAVISFVRLGWCLDGLG
jgi:hypothetical protein